MIVEASDGVCALPRFTASTRYVVSSEESYTGFIDHDSKRYQVVKGLTNARDEEAPPAHDSWSPSTS